MKRSIVTVALMTACAAGSAVAHERGDRHAAGSATLIHDLTRSAPAGCDYLGTVSGTYRWQGAQDPEAVAQARITAREEAARLGATHVYWTTQAQGYSASSAGAGMGEATVGGQAWRCPPS